MSEASTQKATEGPAPAGPARAVLLAALAAVELPLLAFLYDPLTINDTAPGWLATRAILREGVPAMLFFGAALAIIMTPHRREVRHSWTAMAHHHPWRGPLAVNLVLFTALAILTPAFNAYGAQLDQPPWGLFWLWSAGVATAYAVLLFAMAPLEFWRDFVNRHRTSIALAAGAAMVIQTAAVLSRQSWNALSEATFTVSAAILRLYEQDVSTIPEQRVIGVGEFDVNIAAACSGYEGIGLVVTFLAVYLWIFRTNLKFPNVFWVLPIGVAAIWLLNALRIALLVSIGAHISPEIAIGGFHSQAGWMMFLIVTIGIMITTHRISFFRKSGEVENKAPSPAAYEATALLAPFLAMMAAAIVAGAFANDGDWLYALRVAAISLAVFACWRFYRAMDWRIGAEPFLAGLLVGVLWIASDPGHGMQTELGAWLNGLAPPLFALWIALRVTGAVLLVPLAEELAFRGYLHRKLVSARFEQVSEAAFSWKAFLVSSILFGTLHERWLAGFLAGAVFALVLYRSGKLSGAIAAHMTANAVIAIWAVAMRQWSLL